MEKREVNLIVVSKNKSEVKIIDNPTKYQKIINDLIKEYENAHHKRTNFNNELQKRATQPGFEF